MYMHNEHFKGNRISHLLLAGFVFLNVLVMLLMVRFVPGYYHKFVSRVNGDVNTRHTSLSFYWGCALVFFFLAMALHSMDLWMFYALCIELTVSDSPLFNDFTVSLITCFSTTFVVMVVELIVCVFVCKRNTITVDIPFQRCTTNVLFCCCCCCCCSSNLKSKVVQTLALWGIMHGCCTAHHSKSDPSLFHHYLTSCRGTVYSCIDRFYIVLYHYICSPLAPSPPSSWSSTKDCFLYPNVCHCILYWFGYSVTCSLLSVFACWCGIQWIGWFSRLSRSLYHSVSCGVVCQDKVPRHQDLCCRSSTNCTQPHY